MFWNFVSFSYQGGGIGRINGRETFSYNLHIDREWSRNTHTCTDWLQSYRHSIYGSRFRSPSSNTTSRVEGETTSRSYQWKTYRIRGYYTCCESRNHDPRSSRTIADVCYKIGTLSNCSWNSLATTTWCCSTVCIYYGYLRVTVLHDTLPWCTCYAIGSYGGTSSASLSSWQDIWITDTPSRTLLRKYCYAQRVFILPDGEDWTTDDI